MRKTRLEWTSIILIYLCDDPRHRVNRERQRKKAELDLLNVCFVEVMILILEHIFTSKSFRFFCINSRAKGFVPKLTHFLSILLLIEANMKLDGANFRKF